MTQDKLIMLISERGDTYGNHGGTLDLLMWCNKNRLMDVTLEEAARFYENPNAPYIRESDSRDSGHEDS